MYIKVKEKWIEVVDESTNGVEHIYYDPDGNGYYDYEVEEIAASKPLGIKELEEAVNFQKQLYAKFADDSIQYITYNTDPYYGTSNSYEWKVVDKVPSASNEMQEAKLFVGDGLMAQINALDSTNSIKVVEESDLKKMYKIIESEPIPIRRSKRKKTNTQSTNEVDTSN